MSNKEKRIATFTAEQRKMLLQRLQKKQTDVSQTPLLPYKRDTNIFPVSFAQQRLWFLDQMQPGSSAYLISRAHHFPGDLNVEVLEGSLVALVQRHEALRTTFEMQDGHPMQVIHTESHVAFPLIDLERLQQEQRDKEAQRLIRQEALRPCNLEQGPLFRAALLRVDKQMHIMLLTLHHIITDQWSNEILEQELSIFYQAYCNGYASPLTPLALQYVDYALWQRQRLQGQLLETQLAYWRKQLAGAPPLELPTDHPRPAIQTYRGARQTRLVPVTTLVKLQRLSQQEDVTMFMLLLAAFQVLLLRYSGQSDISIGTPIANRTRAEIERVVGFFVNTLVIRSDLSGNPTFQQILRKVHEVCLQAYAHQDVPFEKVVEELEPERDLRRSPLFQIMFMLQNAAREQGELTGVNLEPQIIEHISSKFDLTLALVESRHGLRCSVEYNTDLFEVDTIARLLDHWLCLLQGLVQMPHAHLSELPLLTEDEQRHLLIDWNATQATYPEEVCLHHLFEQQVLRTPDAIAVECGQEQLTYEQLNWRSNQVAHYLQHLGVGPDVLVGIGLERSVEQVIGILGILKAGGAYIPLDTTYPLQRLNSIVESAHLSILVTTSSSRKYLPSIEHIVYLDNDWATIAHYKGEETPRSMTLPTNLAYVIYTSGSTGQPKGVMISHQGVVHYVDWSSRHYAVAAGSGSPVQSPLSFDLTITSLFPALIVGRRVVLVPEAPGIEAFRQILLMRNAFSLLKITPAHLNLLIQSLQPEEFTAVAQTLIIGGEALQAESVRAWHEHAPATRLINEYGPTETVVGCCIYEITPGEKPDGTIPIGRPIPNTQIYLLDPELCVVPFGVPGEIYIAGVGLGRGYLNRPDLTAERFIANPFSKEPGARLYKTGDLARYVPDKEILEYIGRVDDQVKLRGYRIELAEIETVLKQHPQVEDCVVLLQEGYTDNARLISYVVAHAEAQLTAAVLAEMSEKYLPAYMVPSVFVILEALPLTANGKVDRRQLASLEPLPKSKAIALNEPRSPIEDVLLKIWRDLLAAPWLGIHDNFFVAGGHSLLVMRLIAQIRVILQVEISIRAIFEEPTVAEFAVLVEQAIGENVRQEFPPLVAEKRSKTIPLSFAQQRLWFLDQLQPGNIAYLVPGVQHFLGPVHIEALTRSLEELTHRHESLRTTFALQSGQPVQLISEMVNCSLPLIDLRRLEPERRKAAVRLLRSLESQQPFDLEQGPLLRMYLVRLDSEEHVLLLTLHHIITDGWSNKILLNELITLYQAYKENLPSPLVPLPVQYADYALWQRKWLRGEVLERQLDYWIRQLGGAQEIKLPADYPRPSMPSSRGAIHHFVLSRELSQKLIALSSRENMTLFMTLLAAFQVLFYRYTGQTDIIIGTDSVNRNHMEIEGIIGFFVNLLALRVDLSSGPSFREVLKRVRAVVLAAYIHCDTPFELLVEKLVSDHRQELTPLIRVLLVLQDMPIKVQELTDVVPEVESREVEQLQVHSGTDKETKVKFDMALFMQEHEGQLFGTLNYRLDLFQQGSIATFIARFLTLLESSVDHPDLPIDLLDIAKGAESKKNTHGERKIKREINISNDGWLDLPTIHSNASEKRK